MESAAPTPRYRILGHSSMFRFLPSLVGSQGSPKSSEKALLRDRACPSQEQDAIPLMIDRQEGLGKEPRPPTTVSYTLSVALPPKDPSGLGMGDMGTQTPTPAELLKVMAQGVEVKSVRPRGSQEVSEKEERTEVEKKAAGKASGDPGTSERGRFAQALQVDQGCLQSSRGPLEVSTEAFTREEEERLLDAEDGDLRLASSKVGATPWTRLLTVYKQLQKSTIAQFPLKENLLHEEESEEKEMEEEDSSCQLCVPSAARLQPPLHKTCRSTNTVGFVESEFKKVLAVQWESRLWKVGIHKDQELLISPEIPLEDAGIVDDQGHQAEREGSHPPLFGECWGPGGGVLRQLERHPRLEGRVQSPLGVSSTEHLLLEEMDEMGSGPLE